MNADARYYMMLDEIVALKKEHRLLEAQLAESQRREKAAVLIWRSKIAQTERRKHNETD